MDFLDTALSFIHVEWLECWSVANVDDQSKLMTIGMRLGGKGNRCIGVCIAIEWVTGNISLKETIVECGDVKEKIFTPSLPLY